MKTLATLALMGTIFLVTEVSAQSQGAVIYRYKNKDGVTVMDSAIPPEYVQGGYDVVTTTGRLLKTVPPALDKATLERRAQAVLAQQEQARIDSQLRKTYSHVRDIDAARERSLESLQGNVSILKANLMSSRKRQRDYEQQAAALERAGQAVPQELLDNIAKTTGEQQAIKAQIHQREVEAEAINVRFERERERFLEITKQP